MLYVEVKLPDVAIHDLLALDQCRRYAKELAGWVLLTNLSDFLLARLDGNKLVEQRHVQLFAGAMFGDKQPETRSEG